jgi:hypothetical protein
MHKLQSAHHTTAASRRPTFGREAAGALLHLISAVAAPLGSRARRSHSLSETIATAKGNVARTTVSQLAQP